jgi:protein subunit release factor A
VPNKKLLFSISIKDCRVDTFTVSGPGGGGKDTSNTGVRVTHPPSGAVGTSSDERSQLKNKQAAFKRMAASKAFKAWHQRVTAELLTGKSVEQRVEEAMEPHNLKVEVKKEGRWVAE